MLYRWTFFEVWKTSPTSLLLRMQKREAVLAGALFLIMGLPAKAELVKGRVVTAEGFPIPSAIIKVIAAGTFRLSPVEPSGSFRVDLESDEPSVTIVITAAGFEERRRTLVFHGGVADGGRIVMQTIQTLRARSITVSRSSDHAQNEIDVLLENPLSRRAEVSAIRIRAMKKKSTHCLDATRPALSFMFGDTISADRIAYTVDEDENGQRKPMRSVETRGSLRLFPCDQVHLDLDVVMPFMLSAAEVAKLRFVVPAKMKIQGRQERADVDLTAFAIVAVTLHTDGRDVTAVRHLP
jgi:hypothetical protein